MIWPNLSNLKFILIWICNAFFRCGDPIPIVCKLNLQIAINLIHIYIITNIQIARQPAQVMSTHSEQNSIQFEESPGAVMRASLKEKESQLFKSLASSLRYEKNLIQHEPKSKSRIMKTNSLNTDSSDGGGTLNELNPGDKFQNCSIFREKVKLIVQKNEQLLEAPQEKQVNKAPVSPQILTLRQLLKSEKKNTKKSLQNIVDALQDSQRKRQV